MFGKTASTIMLSLLGMSMLALAYNIQIVRPYGLVYIKVDRSVEPLPLSNSPAVAINYATYASENSIDRLIIVERDNLTADWDDCTFEGAFESGSGAGIGVCSMNNMTARSANTTDLYEDIRLYDSPSINLLDNNTIGGHCDISLGSSSNDKTYWSNSTNPETYVILYVGAAEAPCSVDINMMEHYPLIQRCPGHFYPLMVSPESQSLESTVSANDTIGSININSMFGVTLGGVMPHCC